MVLSEIQKRNRAKALRLVRKGFKVAETPGGMTAFSLTKKAAMKRALVAKKLLKKRKIKQVKLVSVTIPAGKRKGRKAFIFLGK